MIIMQVLPALNSGGVERGAVDIANYTVKSGNRAIIVSSGGRLESFLNKSVKHIKLPVDTKNPIKIYKNIKKLRKLVSDYNVDVLHVRSRAPAWSSYFAVKNTPCQLLNTFHGTHSLRFIFGDVSLLKRKYNEIMLKGKKVIAVSNFIKDHIRENYSKAFDEDKIEVIHRGADINLFNKNHIEKEAKLDLIRKWNIPDDKKIIMLPGRITQWKGHEFLIDALKVLDRDDYLCLFVGDYASKGNYKKALEEKIFNLKLEEKVKFVGPCDNMPVAYSLCDVVISASVQPEAFGRIAIEAQSMEKVIIATNIGGSKETILDSKTGFLVEPRDYNAMAFNIGRVLSMDESLKTEMGSMGRQNVIQNFSNDLMFKETLKIYQELYK